MNMTDPWSVFICICENVRKLIKKFCKSARFKFSQSLCIHLTLIAVKVVRFIVPHAFHPINLQKHWESYDSKINRNILSCYRYIKIFTELTKKINGNCKSENGKRKVSLIDEFPSGQSSTFSSPKLFVSVTNHNLVFSRGGFQFRPYLVVPIRKEPRKFLPSPFDSNKVIRSL